MVIIIAPNKLQEIIKFGSMYQYTPKPINSGPRMWKNEKCSLSLPSVGVGMAASVVGFFDLEEFFFFFGFLTTTSHFPPIFS